MEIESKRLISCNASVWRRVLKWMQIMQTDAIEAVIKYVYTSVSIAEWCLK